MSYQVYSDIHTEFSKKKFPKIIPTAPYLILPGDIGKITMDSFRDFISYCSSKWIKVFFIFGNHEFYGSRSIETLKIQYREFFSTFPNVILLDSEYTIIDNTVIYGFTCWTRCPYQKLSDAKDNLNDYNQIRTIKGKLTATYINELVDYETLKFKEFIDKINTGEIECDSLIVVTHFPPIREGTSDPIYSEGRSKSDPINEYFSWKNYFSTNNIVCDKLRVWISGHTHWCYDLVKQITNPQNGTTNNVRLIANQIGYSGENTGFTDFSFSL